MRTGVGAHAGYVQPTVHAEGPPIWALAPVSALLDRQLPGSQPCCSCRAQSFGVTSRQAGLECSCLGQGGLGQHLHSGCGGRCPGGDSCCRAGHCERDSCWRPICLRGSWKGCQPRRALRCAAGAEMPTHSALLSQPRALMHAGACSQPGQTLTSQQTPYQILQTSQTDGCVGGAPGSGRGRYLREQPHITTFFAQR